MRDDSKRRVMDWIQYRKKLEESVQQQVNSGWNRTLPDVGKIAIVCIAKDEDQYIEEWIDYHLKLGVDEIVLYEHNWKSNVENDRVLKIEWNGKNRYIVYAYNHFIFNHGKDYDWVIFIDVDEFLVLHKHNSIREFLKDYGNLPEHVDAIAVNWMMFGDNNAPSSGSVLERFTRRGEEPERHIKLIMRMNGDRLMIGPHHSFGLWIDTNGQVGAGQNNFKPAVDVVQLNHYFCKTFPEYEQKMAKGRVDSGMYRTEEDFHLYNENDVEDLTALEFSRK